MPEVGRDEERLAQMQAELARPGREVEIFRADLAKPDEGRGLAERAEGFDLKTV